MVGVDTTVNPKSSKSRRHMRSVPSGTCAARVEIPTAVTFLCFFLGNEGTDFEGVLLTKGNQVVKGAKGCCEANPHLELS